MSHTSLTPSTLLTLHVTVTAPTATKHVAIPKALNAIKEELRLALDTADMSSPTPGEEKRPLTWIVFQRCVTSLDGGKDGALEPAILTSGIFVEEVHLS